jgi:hypothetical protein
MTNRESSLRKKYSFTFDESKRLLNLFPSLRNDVSNTASLPEKTRTKLLGKLDEIIETFDLKMQNLDIFWSFIGWMEIAFRVYGRNSIPAELKQMMRIIWLVQCRTEGRSQNSLPPIIL